MNPSIVRLYVLVLALFAAVVGFTSYWAIFDADELRERPDNRRSLIEAQKIPRGTITTVDGTEVAVSRPQGQGNQRIFTREYPQGDVNDPGLERDLGGRALGDQVLAERERGERVGGQHGDRGSAGLADVGGQEVAREHDLTDQREHAGRDAPRHVPCHAARGFSGDRHAAQL